MRHRRSINDSPNAVAMDRKAIDWKISEAARLKLAAENAAKNYDQYRRKVLVPLAKRFGYRRGSAWLLQGHDNAALVERVLDVFIADQVAAAKLPPAIRRAYLRAVYKPGEFLAQMARGKAWSVRDGRVLQRFIDRAVKTRRYWRVAKLNVRSVRVHRRSSAVPSSRRKAA